MQSQSNVINRQIVNLNCMKLISIAAKPECKLLTCLTATDETSLFARNILRCHHLLLIAQNWSSMGLLHLQSGHSFYFLVSQIFYYEQLEVAFP